MAITDYTILRELGKRYADIAALPIHKEKQKLWIMSNGLKQTRPMVAINQIPWHELNADGSLTLQCGDPFCRMIEDGLRKTLFQWKHFPCDMVILPQIRIPKAVSGLNLGISVAEHTLAVDSNNDIVAHHYKNQLQTLDDLEKIKMPNIILDTKETNRREAIAHDIFNGILEVYMEGVSISCALWDRIVEWMGTETLLYDFIDRPDFIHEIINRTLKGYMSMVDQLEELNLFEGKQQLIHCSGAYSDDLLPGGKACNAWTYGMAQFFATVSPQMHKEFEIDYVKQLYTRFGLVYYGCCEPLDKKIDLVRLLPNIRKISVSPWADPDVCAEEIGLDYVYSAKPSPTPLAAPAFDISICEKEIQHRIDVCKKNHCNLELILKDISTVQYDLSRLEHWAQMAMKLAEGI